MGSRHKQGFISDQWQTPVCRSIKVSKENKCIKIIFIGFDKTFVKSGQFGPCAFIQSISSLIRMCMPENMLGKPVKFRYISWFVNRESVNGNTIYLIFTYRIMIGPCHVIKRTGRQDMNIPNIVHQFSNPSTVNFCPAINFQAISLNYKSDSHDKLTMGEIIFNYLSDSLV